MKKKLLSAALLLAFILTLGGCAGTGTALTVGKNRIDEAEYAFYLNYNRYVNGSGDEPDMDAVRAEAVNQIVRNEIVRIKCRELGIELSREQRQKLSSDKKEFIELLGGKAAFLSYLKDSYMTDREYDKIAENELYFNMLFERMTAENSYTEEELRRFYSENYIGVKYVFLSTTDDEGEPLPDEEIKAVREKAEEVLAKARDPENDFDDLINEYSDDVFGAGGAGGLIVSRLEAEGQSYIAGAFGISDNEVGGVFSDDTGFYVVKRVPTDVTFYEENRAAVNDTAANMRFASLLDEWSANTRVNIRGSVKRINFKNLKNYVR